MKFTLPFILTIGAAWWFFPIEEHIPKILDAREKRMEARRLKAVKKEEQRRKAKEQWIEQARKKEEERLYWEHLHERSDHYKKDLRERKERRRERDIAKFMEEYRAKMKAKEQGEKGQVMRN